MSPLEDIAFCSKVFYLTPAGLEATRNYAKTLSTKMYYTKDNAMMYRQPDLHALAILSSVQSEQASILVEDIIKQRIRSPTQLPP